MFQLMNNMRRIHIIIWIALLGCMGLSACTEQLDEWTTDNRISLSAEVENVMPTARSESYAEPVADNNLTAAVWFSLEPGKYPDGPVNEETNIPGHYDVDFQGEAAVFPDVDDENDRPRYPIPDEDGKVQDVYCVGFYPHTGWTYVSGTANNPSTATHAITGFEDLMFAPPIQGNWNNHFDKQKFTHLLTWLKVCVCATTTEAGNYWGKLKSITLVDVPTGLQINDLSKMQSDYENANRKVTLTSSDISPIKDEAGDTILHSPNIVDNSSGIELGINIQDVGSIFCYPQSSYTLIIECENGKTIEKKVDLKALSGGTIVLPAGYQYVLTLNFHPFNVVEGVCTLNAWNAQNEDLYPDQQQ